MSPSAVYSKDERSQGHRLAKRTRHEQDQIHDIVNESPILHVSFNAPLRDGPQFPTILPMLGAMGTYGDDDDDDETYIYLHGSSAARLFMLTDGGEVPLCVCATLIDGYVLALAPFHNSCNYRSAVLFGYGSVVEDEAEVTHALRLITNNLIPQRWENSRAPPTKTEMASTGVVKMRVETASVKTRTGGPQDEKFDLRNPEVVDRTWTGVVPTYTTLGEPVAGEHNRVKQTPGYLVDWVEDVNSLNEQRAIDAMDEKKD